MFVYFLLSSFSVFFFFWSKDSLSEKELNEVMMSPLCTLLFWQGYGCYVVCWWVGLTPGMAVGPALAAAGHWWVRLLLHQL